MSTTSIASLEQKPAITNVLVVLLDEANGEIKSRTKYQHMVYMLQYRGVKLGLEFSQEHFGPWDGDVVGYLYGLVATGDIKEKMSYPYGSCMGSHIYTITASGRLRAEYVREKIGRDSKILGIIRSVANEWRGKDKVASMHAVAPFWYSKKDLEEADLRRKNLRET